MKKRRGFIVAIETYAQMQEGLSSTLTGTHQAAAEFRDWLINHQALAPQDIYYCTEDSSIAGRTAGANRQDIIDELVRLKHDGKDQTDELYFLYIGHGLCYKDIDGVRLADIMLAANYRCRERSGGDACLKIDEIQKWLRLCMGSNSADHFYFIDACRNNISERDIKVATLGLTYDSSNLGIPTVYTLYSTVEGAVADVNSGFVKVLVAALKGSGRAKVWRGADMVVFFRSVKDYVEKNLSKQKVDERKEGSRDGLIREITPPPKFTCEVEVQNAVPSDQFTLSVTNQRNQPVVVLPFTGPQGSFSQIPDDYNLAVTIPSFVVDAIDPLPADLYDDRKVRFVKQPVRRSATRHPPSFRGPVAVTIHAPDQAKVVVQSLDRGETVEGSGIFRNELVAGPYLLKTVDERGVTLDRRRIDITGQTPMEFDLAVFERSPLRDTLRNAIPGAHGGGTVDLSETLGPLPDQGLDLWLALIGASRIVGGPEDFSKLGPLPLLSFTDAPLDSAPIYLLAGFDQQPERLAVGISNGPDVTLVDLATHPKFPGLFEWHVPSMPGYQLISVKVDENAAMTFGACTLANRATLITLSTGERNALRVQQFMLPIRHLAGHLPSDAAAFFLPDNKDTPLKSVRRMVDIQRQFAQSKELTGVIPQEQLDELLYMKWFEPIAAILAAYELARRGRLRHLEEVVGNLRRYFALLPDTEAIAKMANQQSHLPPYPPLLLDGLLTLNMPREKQPLDPEKLDFRGPWTAWTGAVTATGSTLRRQ